MGLMEQLIEAIGKLGKQVDDLNSALATLKPITTNDESTTASERTNVVSTVEQTTTKLPGEGVELDKNGIPWDERIHAGTKRKNADGTWSLKKGVDKELAAQIIAEYKAAPDYVESPDLVSEAPAKPDAPTAPAKPGVPTAPAKPGVPTAPAKPGVPTAPKAEDAGPTVKAARLSNVLINDMGVDYDLVIAGVLAPRGYDQFGSVPAEQAADVLKDLEKWEENLKNLVKEFADLRGMAEGTEHAQAVEEGLAYYVSNNDGEGDDPTTIPFAKLYDAYVEVAKWSNEWEPVLVALKG